MAIIPILIKPLLKSFVELCVFAFCSLLLYSCSGTLEPQHENQGPEPLSFTVYSEHYELFVEFPPLVLGKTASFAAHFTKTGDLFLPLTEGKVTLTLVVGERGLRTSAEQASSPGIFRLGISPVASGLGTLTFIVESNGISESIVLDSIPVFDKPEEALKFSNEWPRTVGEIAYLKEQAWKTDFSTQKLEYLPFAEVISCVGRLKQAVADEQIVVSSAEGVLSFASFSPVLGLQVSKSQELFVLSSKSLTENNLETKIAVARAEVEKSRLAYDRALLLYKENAGSQRDVEEKKAAYEVAESGLKALTKNYSGELTKVFSPMSAYIKEIYAQEGQFVRLGDPVLKLAKSNKILLEVDVPQKYFSKLPLVKSANFVASDASVLSTEQLNGKVLSFAKSLKADEFFVPLCFEMDNLGALLPGSMVEVSLKTSSTTSCLLLPKSAVIEELGSYYVYVQLSGESFTKRQVQLGASDGFWMQVLSGLSAGERVVTKGAMAIKLAHASGAMPAHGHVH